MYRAGPRLPEEAFVSATQIPKLVFAIESWTKLQGLLRLSDQEISGFGRVKQVDGIYLVDEIIVLEQTVNTVHTKMDMFAVAEFITALIEAGENPEDYLLWWHSHVYHGLFWSPTDEDTMRQLTQTFMFGLVGLKDGRVKVRLDIAKPAVVVDDIPVDVDYMSAENFAWCSEQIEQKIAQFPQPPAVVDDEDFVPTATEEYFGDEFDEEYDGDSISAHRVRIRRKDDNRNGHKTNRRTAKS